METDIIEEKIPENVSKNNGKPSIIHKTLNLHNSLKKNRKSKKIFSFHSLR